MRFGSWLLLALISLLLAASIVLGQLAYRVDRTVLSYRYMTEAVPEIIEPLEEPEVHEDTVTALAGIVRREADLGLPPQLVRLFDQAAVAAFDASWFEWTLTRNIYAIIGVLRGSRAELRIPVNISGFESQFVNLARKNLPQDMVRQITAETANLPGAFDLAEAMPEEARAALLSFGRRYGLLSTAVMYVIPALLTIACFSFRRLGTAFLGGGLGYLLGGGVVLIWGEAFGRMARTIVVAASRSALPGGFTWLTSGLAELTSDLAAGLWQYAALIAGVGVLSTALGGWLVFSGRNDTLDFSHISASDTDIG